MIVDYIIMYSFCYSIFNFYLNRQAKSNCLADYFSINDSDVSRKFPKEIAKEKIEPFVFIYIIFVMIK